MFRQSRPLSIVPPMLVVSLLLLLKLQCIHEPLGILLKRRFWFSLAWSLRLCIFNEYSIDAAVGGGRQTTLWGAMHKPRIYPHNWRRLALCYAFSLYQLLAKMNFTILLSLGKGNSFFTVVLLYKVARNTKLANTDFVPRGNAGLGSYELLATFFINRSIYNLA